jgi:peptidyl-tRNA hydrolase
MSAGKIAAQCFQAAQRLFARASSPSERELQGLLSRWQELGTLTICRIAQTPHVFERALAELDGALMVDEGVNEVAPGSPTVFATVPLDVRSAPSILRHKRMPLLTPETVARCSHARVPASV